MGQTASIAGKHSWPQLFVPITGAVVARVLANKSGGQRIILWGTATTFILAYFTGLVTNVLAQKKKCQKKDVRKAIAPALAPAVMAGIAGLATFAAIKYIKSRPEAKAAMTAMQSFTGGSDITSSPNLVFAGVLPVTLFAFIGNLIGTTAAMNRVC